MQLKYSKQQYSKSYVISISVWSYFQRFVYSLLFVLTKRNIRRERLHQLSERHAGYNISKETCLSPESTFVQRTLHMYLFNDGLDSTHEDEKNNADIKEATEATIIESRGCPLIPAKTPFKIHF